ncbi:unnamed protein product [Rotaria magnacalcarata]|uniref:Uncharacterized protein n=1 Tax=Rotaria magnacalcarata TaxID=392030 RepID=A0A8S2LQ65_9BILA|nr:unnamed protein product [Rotaria magnacalcarata]CAF3973003.1 unnamed protein product [Rotaria magnacalcarata]CAF3995346.1 unnamed protein product [Rotaria magnacalcarata]
MRKRNSSTLINESNSRKRISRDCLVDHNIREGGITIIKEIQRENNVQLKLSPDGQNSNKNNTFSFSKINQDTSRDSNGLFSSKNPNNDNHTYSNGGRFAGLSNNRRTNEYSSTSPGAEDDDDYNAFFGSDEETARTTNHNLGQDKNTLAFILFFLQLLHHGIQIILIQ